MTNTATAPSNTTASSTCSTPSATTPQHGSICHIEFSSPDFDKAKKFYGEVFGWEFQNFQENELYFMTPKNWGPCGCVTKGAPAADSKTMIYVNVSDIPGTLTKATKLGALSVKPKTEIPGGHGFYAHMKAPDGNVFGIYSRA
jgi:predicted enzyme related to lactoylglutathione lyase